MRLAPVHFAYHQFEHEFDGESVGVFLFLAIIVVLLACFLLAPHWQAFLTPQEAAGLLDRFPFASPHFRELDDDAGRASARDPGGPGALHAKPDRQIRAPAVGGNG